ncbi:MAG: SIR2 family NAD-dependent protein deacylase [Flavobacteriales bacterium]|jgi:NAD-dependent deacetylase
MKKKLVVLSGSGISAESGINTFRSTNGLWHQYDIKQVATPEAWAKSPDLVTEFYNQRRKSVLEAHPNEAHRKIAALESTYDVVVITQNIDDLHERGGSQNVLHLHGNIRMAKSSGPKAENNYYPIKGWELKASDRCPDGYRLRPHVVWFGEPVPMIDKAIEIVASAAVFVVIGTSLQVYPAAGLLQFVPKNCVCYAIDPVADELSIPPAFEIINENAVAGMAKLYQVLISSTVP